MQPDEFVPGRRSLAGGIPFSSSGIGTAGIAVSPVITFYITYATVMGYTTPNRDVHLVLWDAGTLAGEARTRSDGVGYFYAELMQDGRYAKIKPGQVLDVVVAGSTRSLAVPSITGVVDPGTDTVAGKITSLPPPVGVLLDSMGNRLTVTTDASGNYTGNLGSLLDVSWSTWVDIAVHDSGGNWFVVSSLPQNGVVIDRSLGQVSGDSTPGTIVTVTLNHAGFLSTRTGRTDVRDGWWSIAFDAIASGDIITVQVAGLEITDTVRELKAHADLPNDRITGTGPTNSQVSVYTFREKGLRRWYPFRRVATDATGSFTADFSAVGLDTWSPTWAIHHDTLRADLLFYGNPYLVSVERNSNQVWGYADPGAVLTLTLSDGSTLQKVLEQIRLSAGNNHGDYSTGFQTPFRTGYRMRAEGGGLNTTVDLVPLTIKPDVQTDTFSGETVPNAVMVAQVWSGRDGFYYPHADISSGPTGVYNLGVGSVMDVRNSGWVRILYPQDNNIDQPGWQRRYGDTPYIQLNESHDGVYGDVSVENAPVTLTLRSGDSTVKGVTHAQSGGWSEIGWQQFRDGNGNVIDIAPGDRVLVEVPGWSQSVVAPNIRSIVDAKADRVTGTGPANSFVEVYVRVVWPWLKVPTDGAGRFVADFSGLVDIQVDTEVEVAIYDANWNRLYAVGRPFWARANTAWDAVDGWFGYSVTVQYTVTNGTGAVKRTGQGATHSDGWLDGIGCDCDIAPGDRVQVQSSTGFEALLLPIPIDGRIDIDADRVSGQMRKGTFPAQGGVWIRSNARQEDLWQEMDVAADGSYAADFAGKFDIRLGDTAEVWYFDANDNWVGTMLYTPHLDIELWYGPGGRSEIWGRAEPGAIVIVTTPYTQAVTQADGQGNWRVDQPGPLREGDPISGVATGLPPVTFNVLDPFFAQADADTAMVTGQAGGWKNSRIEVHGYWPDGYREATTDDQGRFAAKYEKVPRGAQGHIRLVNQLAEYAVVIVHRPFYGSELWVRVNYIGNDIEGNYEKGRTVWITVTSESGEVKATTRLTSGPIPWWGRWDGFTTSLGDWSPDQPDIVPGDLVSGSASDGRLTSVRIGRIVGQVDTAHDSITGRVYAPWYGKTLAIDCHPWGAPSGTPSKQSTAGPNGEPPYSCVWDPKTEWDILPGQYIGVFYIDENANWVGNGFREPAPNLHVETWPQGGGEAQAGGPAVFAIRYWNDGDIAGDARLTDTLPPGTTYVGDSSGFTPVVSGNTVAWDWVQCSF